MYQSNLAKNLKKHKKSFPLNLKFTTDLNSLTELFASGRLVVLLMSAGRLGSQIHDHWVYLYWNYCVIQSMLLDMIIPFKWIMSFLSTEHTPNDVFSEYFYYQESNNASCYHSTLWAETKLFQCPILSLTSSVFDWPAFIPSLCNNSVIFLGTTSPYFQSTWFRQSDLTLGFMCECVVHTWSSSTIHLLDHTGLFRNGHVIQVGPVILNPQSFTELWKKRSWETTYWGCLAL